MADQYYDSQSGDPNQTQNSANTDWWTQNAPPANAGIQWNTDIAPKPTTPYGPWGTTPAYSGQAAQGGVTGQNGEPLYLSGATAPQTGGADLGGATFGGPVAPFAYDPSNSGYPSFTPPPLPDYLQQGFQLPSAADLQATPGYMERFRMGQQARERAAAAQGTILNGGTQQALTRYGQDYASNEYSNLANQKLGERQQQSQDYLNLAYGPAWQQNQAAVNQYGTLYNQYKDLTSANRTAQNDYWQQQMDLLNAGLGAAKAGTPGTAGATAG